MKEQNYTNHRRYVTGFHILLSLLLIAGTIISIINVVRHPPNYGGFVSSSLITLLFVCGLIIFWYMRKFPIKAQDRAIRAEEGLRYFIVTGKPFDSRLTMGQIIALRFAPNDELAELAERSVAENLSPVDIKKLVKDWRADHHRM